MLQRLASLLPPDAPFVLSVKTRSPSAGHRKSTRSSDGELAAGSGCTLPAHLVELQGEGNIGDDALVKATKLCVCVFFKL